MSKTQSEKKAALRPMKEMCKTCPWRDDSPYKALRKALSERSEVEGRVCHSTGSSGAIYGDTGKPERICRGSRNEQLHAFHAIGFIEAPTDEAWFAKCREMGMDV